MAKYNRTMARLRGKGGLEAVSSEKVISDRPIISVGLPHAKTAESLLKRTEKNMRGLAISPRILELIRPLRGNDCRGSLRNSCGTGIVLCGIANLEIGHS